LLFYFRFVSHFVQVGLLFLQTSVETEVSQGNTGPTTTSFSVAIMAPQARNKHAVPKIFFVLFIIIMFQAYTTNAMLHGSPDMTSTFGQHCGDAIASGVACTVTGPDFPDLLLSNWLNEDQVIFTTDHDESGRLIQDQAPTYERDLFDTDENENLDTMLFDTGSTLFESEASTFTENFTSEQFLTTTYSAVERPDPLSSRPSSSRLSVITTPNTSFFTSPSIAYSPYEGSIPSAPAMSRQVSGQRNHVDNMFSSFDDFPAVAQDYPGEFLNIKSDSQDLENMLRLTFTSESPDIQPEDHLSSSPDILRDLRTRITITPVPVKQSLSPRPKASNRRQGRHKYSYTCSDCEEDFSCPKDTMYALSFLDNLLLINSKYSFRYFT